MEATACKSCGSFAATRPDGLCDGCGAAVDGGASVATAYATTEQETAERVSDLCAEVALLVGDDGTGNLGMVVRQALADNHAVTAAEVAAIWREAERDHAADVEAE